MKRTVALPMYGLPEVVAHIDASWARLRDELTGRGVEAPARLGWPTDLHRSWEDPALLLSQACGYPLVGALGSSVRVLGTFAGDAVAPGGHYASVIVGSPRGARAHATGAWDGVVAAVNGEWSLSGWISLLAATTGTGAWPGVTVTTGAHVASVRAVQRGAADIASIDAQTFALLTKHRPQAVDGIEVIGEGPLVPALPLITAAGTDDETFAALREALASAPAAHPGPFAAQLIDRFVPFDSDDYAPVARLVEELGVVRPPWP